MKKSFLSLLLVLMTTALYAGKEELYVLYEGFENGIPATWSQINEAGQQQWITESAVDAQYPVGVVEGENRAALRNTTTQTQHFVTKLVTPIFDISKTVHPILMFSHAQAQRTGDVDQLKVYYRQSDKDRWVLLQTYENKITNWTQEIIQLPGACETYQLAFEGTDNLGRGIVLDDIIVRPEPTCEDPFNISVDGLSTTTATLRWNGSLDTEKFRVVISTKAITDMENPEGVIYDDYVNDFEFTIEDLKRNTKYYVYIQAQCGVETSEWASISFTTKNLAEVPYVQDFNKAYASGTVSHVDYWTHGTSIKKDDGTMEFMPFVNQNTAESSQGNYSYSKTTCLVFTGARSTSTDIPAGEYVYAATPELNVPSLKNYQATFWGTCYTQFDEANANGLIVGVMTDPADFATFVAVDTVYSTESRGFARYTVFFDSYEGEGKYIAFASNFVDKPNAFFMDDLEIKEAPALKAITDVTLSNITSKSMTINAKLNGNSAMRLVLMQDTLDTKTGKIFLNPDSLPAQYRLLDKVYDNPSMPLTVELDPSMRGKFLQVFVQPVKGEDKGEMSLPVVALIPQLWDGNEMTITFEETNKWEVKRTTNFGYVSATIKYPYTIMTTPQNLGSTVPAWPSSLSGSGYGYNSQTSVYLGKEQQEWAENDIKYYQVYGDYVALPEVEDMSNLMIQFYLRGYSDSYTEISRVAVGVMTDPFDPSTFEPIAYCESPKAKTWVPCVVSFNKYKGNGHFPAIMADVAPKKYKYSTTSGSGGSYTTYKLSYQYVDDIMLRPMEGCIMPTDLAAKQADTTVVISWEGNGMKKFTVNIFSDEEMKDTVMNAVVEDTTAYKFEGLKPHTLYYYNVETLCESDTLASILGNFKTECAVSGEPIPYVEGFEDYESGSTTQIMPACWDYILQKVVYTGSGESSTSYYPYIGSSTYAHTGTKGFYFQYYKTSSSYNITPKMDDQPSFVALPLMAEELNKLQMTFWMKAGGTAYVGDSVYVGVMSDPTNLATFDTLQLVKTTAAYSEYIIRFDKYAGQGKYIAFLKTPRALARACYLDDIKVDYLAECEKVQGVTATNANEIGATISWNKGSATQWEIVVANDTLSAEKIAAKDVAIVKDTITTENPFVVDFCNETNKAYYVYVRALCGDDNKGDWSNVMTFKTTCVAKTAEGYGFIDFAKDGFGTSEFPCWTVGRREGTTAVPSVTAGSHLYMFNSTSSEGAYAIMPPIDVEDISKLQVKFTASGGTGAAYLRQLTVGIITNSSDLSTFEAIETVDLPKAVTTISKANHAMNLDEAQTFIVRFDKYKGDYEGNYGKQIMFLSENGGVANYIYIYSMQVSEIPSCLEPIKVNAVEVNTYDATIGWDTIASAYQVQLLADDKETVLVDSITNKQQMKFEGLTMLTKYYAQVRTICGVGDTSAWSPMGNFTTECPAAYPVPYEQNFDDYASGAANYPECWERFSNSSTTYPYVYSSAKKDGKNGLYMYRTTSYYSYAILPNFEGKPGSLMLELDYRNSSTSYPMEMYIGIATDITSVEGIDSTIVMIDTLTAEKYSAPNNVWYHYAQSLEAYTGETGRIVFVSPIAASSSTNGYAYLDNVYVSKTPTCFRPIEPTFASATASSITLTWTPQGNETAWDIACLLAGEEDMTKATITTVSGEGPKGTVTGLLDATDYDFYVRANCGEGDFSEWSSMVSGKTLCIIPVAEANWNFDDYTTRVLNPNAGNNTSYMIEQCWLSKSTSTTASSQPYLNKNTYSTSNSDVEYVSSKYACTDTFALKFYSTATAPAIAVLPELVADLDTMQISFVGRSVYESYSTSKGTAGQFTKYYNTYATGSYGRTLKIGTVTDPYDMSTFEELVDYQFAEVTNANCSTKVEGDYWEPVTVSLYGAAGKYIAFLAEYNGSNYAWIDNVKVEKETGLNMPTCLRVPEDKLGGYSADITWKSRANKFEVVVKNADGEVIAKDTVATMAYTAKDLTPTKTYTVEICAMSDDALSKSAAAKKSFTTPCVPYTKENAYWDFKNADYAYTGNTSYLIPTCWDAGQAVKASATTYTYTPQAKVNTATYQYSREAYDGSAMVHDRALQFYNYSTTYADSYVILPDLDVDMDSTALHFWMRAAYFYTATYSSSASRNKLYAANNNYNKELTIGVIADETDITTFEAIDKVTYPYSWSANGTVFTYNDESGNDYWTEVVVPLKKYKGKGRIVLLYEGNGKSSYMYVDDLEIVDASFCTAPTGVRGDNITNKSADIVWSVAGKDSVILQVATADDFEEKNLIVNDTLANYDGKYELTDLNSGTTYYARMMHLCGEEEASDWSVVSSFSTLYDVRFFEDFAAVRTYPVDWTRCNSKVVDVLDGGATPAPITSETAVNWVRDPGTSDMTASTGTATGSSSSVTYYNYWLMTPTISLKDAPQADKLMLSFDLSLSASDGSQPFNKPSEFDQFIVVVSTDGGKTYPRANATIWNSNGGNYDYSTISGVPTKQMVDLSNYAGKDIIVAFVTDAHSELDIPCSKNDVHLDNVQINGCDVAEYSRDICQYNDYEDANFFIDANDLIVGKTTVYTAYDASTKDGVNDTYTKLSLTVNCAVTTSKPITLCEGENYLEYNFAIYDVTQSATYKQKLEAATGCDSISEVVITVLPRIYNTTEKTICQGDFYEFGGVKYYTSTIVSDTVQSLVTGCDSITTLYLTVNAILAGTTEADLCEGDTIVFGKYTITEGGTYVDTLKNALGCDSVATLVVTMRENYATTTRAAICQGEKYSDDVFQGLGEAGDYPSEQKTIYGCDSIVTLHLLVAGENLTLKDQISVEELPYVINGEELLPIGTAEGTYQRTIELNCGTATITITVGDVSALPQVTVGDLMVSPNPVQVGEAFYVTGNFTSDATMTIINANGQTVYEATPVDSPVLVPGLPATGVYVVNVTSANGVYATKVIVY